jgi:hypothetical protein
MHVGRERVRGDAFVVTPLNFFSPSPSDESPDEAPAALQGIAERLQKAWEELFAVKAQTEEISITAKLPEEVERVLSTPRTEGQDGHEITATAEPSREHAELVERRLYAPFSDGWSVRIKTGQREFCHYRQPGEEWFHILINGELYLQRGSERVCLNCAHRQGILTDDRLYWQRPRKRSPAPFIEPPEPIDVQDTVGEASRSFEDAETRGERLSGRTLETPETFPLSGTTDSPADSTPAPLLESNSAPLLASNNPRSST